MFSQGLKAALSGETTPKFMATLDAGGHPNCVPVISLSPWDGDMLVFGEFFMNKTRKNLLVNSRVGIAVINDKFERWSLKGSFQGFETTGPLVDWLNQTPMFRYNAYTSARSAGLVKIDDVTPLPALSKAGLLRNFAWLRLLALASKSGGRNCMPRRVRDKFQRLRAARACAFQGEDSYPRAIPTMACVPAGSARLLMKAPQFPIRDGSEVAVAIITADPIAYQVKGTYRPGLAGCGILDLHSCYSASPPLLGERLDTPGAP